MEICAKLQLFISTNVSRMSRYASVSAQMSRYATVMQPEISYWGWIFTKIKPIIVSENPKSQKRESPESSTNSLQK